MLNLLSNKPVEGVISTPVAGSCWPCREIMLSKLCVDGAFSLPWTSQLSPRPAGGPGSNVTSF